MLSVSLPEFPNYIVYFDGRVYSTKRNMFIKQSIDKYGYNNIQLNSNGKMKNFKMHRLLAMCFFPHNANLDKIQIDHINRIRNDNRLENLRFADYEVQQKNSKRKKLPFGILPFIYKTQQNNKDKILVYYHNYLDKNRDKINEKVKCECGCDVLKRELIPHQKTKKHIKLMNQIKTENKN